jgi:CRP/FNR family cyclic AMP-dependent transcriptional regulator
VKNTLLLLRELNNDDLDWFANHGKLRKLSNGETLIYEGQPISALYFILSGTLSVRLTSIEDRELARVSSGEIVGEISFVDDRMPIATVVAIADVIALEIPRFHLTKKLSHDLGFASRFYLGVSACLADRMRGTVGRLGYGVEVVLNERFDLLEPSEIELVRTKFRWLVQRSGAVNESSFKSEL